MLSLRTTIIDAKAKNTLLVAVTKVLKFATLMVEWQEW